MRKRLVNRIEKLLKQVISAVVQAWEGVSGFQLCGSNSWSRLMECTGIGERTSRNQANGSTRLRLQEAMKLRSTAAVFPPLSLPKNVQLPRPIAITHPFCPYRAGS